MDREYAHTLRTMATEDAPLYLGHYGLQMLCVLAGTDPTDRKKFSELIGADWADIAYGNGARELFDLDLIEADLDGQYPIKLNERGEAAMADWVACCN